MIFNKYVQNLKIVKNNYLSIFYIMTDNLQERNDKLLNNIKALQTTEMKLYNSLENQQLTFDQKQQIIDQINKISQMRINMYAILKDSYSNYQQNVSTSRNTLNDQIVAIDVIENELNNSKRRLNYLQEEKSNKLRLVGINTYYGKQYNAHKEVMKTVVYVCIPVLILTILANKGILPGQLNLLLSGVIIIIGCILIGYQIIDLFNRDNMNFDEYNWYFNKNNIDTSLTSSSDSNFDPWAMIPYTCIGAECCDDNNTYDSSQNKCIPTAEYNANQSKIINISSVSTTKKVKESMMSMSDVFTKYASSANYPETRLHGNIKAYNSFF
jgi:hypothetical protein